jgi:hypothetical protein
MGEGRDVYRNFVAKPKGMRPFGRPRRRWEDNIKEDLQDVRCGGMDRIELAKDRDRWRGTCECGNEASGSIKFREFLD